MKPVDAGSACKSVPGCANARVGVKCVSTFVRQRRKILHFYPTADVLVRSFDGPVEVSPICVPLDKYEFHRLTGLLAKARGGKGDGRVAAAAELRKRLNGKAIAVAALYEAAKQLNLKPLDVTLFTLRYRGSLLIAAPANASKSFARRAVAYLWLTGGARLRELYVGAGMSMRFIMGMGMQIVMAGFAHVCHIGFLNMLNNLVVLSGADAFFFSILTKLPVMGSIFGAFGVGNTTGAMVMALQFMWPLIVSVVFVNAVPTILRCAMTSISKVTPWDASTSLYLVDRLQAMLARCVRILGDLWPRSQYESMIPIEVGGYVAHSTFPGPLQALCIQNLERSSVRKALPLRTHHGDAPFYKAPQIESKVNALLGALETYITASVGGGLKKKGAAASSLSDTSKVFGNFCKVFTGLMVNEMSIFSQVTEEALGAGTPLFALKAAIRVYTGDFQPVGFVMNNFQAFSIASNVITYYSTFSKLVGDESQKAWVSWSDDAKELRMLQASSPKPSELVLFVQKRLQANLLLHSQRFSGERLQREVLCEYERVASTIRILVEMFATNSETIQREFYQEMGKDPQFQLLMKERAKDADVEEMLFDRIFKGQGSPEEDLEEQHETVYNFLENKYTAFVETYRETMLHGMLAQIQSSQQEEEGMVDFSVFDDDTRSLAKHAPVLLGRGGDLRPSRAKPDAKKRDQP